MKFDLSDLKDLTMADSGIHDDVLDIQEAFDDIKDLIQLKYLKMSYSIKIPKHMNKIYHSFTWSLFIYFVE